MEPLQGIIKLDDTDLLFTSTEQNVLELSASSEPGQESQKFTLTFSSGPIIVNDNEYWSVNIVHTDFNYFLAPGRADNGAHCVLLKEGEYAWLVPYNANGIEFGTAFEIVESEGKLFVCQDEEIEHNVTMEKDPPKSKKKWIVKPLIKHA